jgi:hypothetical protein
VPLAEATRVTVLFDSLKEVDGHASEAGVFDQPEASFAPVVLFKAGPVKRKLAVCQPDTTRLAGAPVRSLDHGYAVPSIGIHSAFPNLALIVPVKSIAP